MSGYMADPMNHVAACSQLGYAQESIRKDRSSI